MTRPYGGGCSVEGGSNLNVKVGQIYLTINTMIFFLIESRISALCISELHVYLQQCGV